MAVQKFGATQVFDGGRFLEPGTVIVVDAGGTIVDVVRRADAGEGVQELTGILLPGLVNAHCHLELSHFKGLIPEGGGLVQFLLAVVGKRKEAWDPAFIHQQVRAAAAEMQAGGIVAVGDICNTTDAVAVKLDSGLRWHNLVEVLNFSDATLAPRLAHNEGVLQGHIAAGLQQSVLTAHAPYSVSPATFRALNEATAGRVISVHNQETTDENRLFEFGDGAFLQLYGLTGTPPLGPTGRSSLQTWLPYFTEGQTILLVHNTFTRQEDIDFARAHAARYGLSLVWCLCPGANKYIETQLPPLELLLRSGVQLVLGTDSYSSNWQLSVAAEIKLLADACPHLPLEPLLQAATRNGAEAFGWQDLGHLKVGSRPGLALLHTDAQGKLTGTSGRLA